MRKIKLDENFRPAMIDIFLKKKIDASSVYKQQLSGTDDDGIFEIYINEGRALVTFDLDFANILRYPSGKTPGIIIARSKRKINLAGIKSLCERLASLIAKEDIRGKLYIVEETKVRVRKPES